MNYCCYIDFSKNILIIAKIMKHRTRPCASFPEEPFGGRDVKKIFLRLQKRELLVILDLVDFPLITP